MHARLIVPLLFLAGAAYPLSAQDQPPQDALSGLRGQAAISEQDQAEIRRFVTERVGEIVSNDPRQAQAAAAALRSAYAGSDAFKRALAANAVPIVSSAYKKAELMPAVLLITLLNTYETIEALPVLLEALRDERVGVRAAAAIGLDRLRPQIAAGGVEGYNRVVAALVAAGKQERAAATLRAIYAALDYTTVNPAPGPKANADAILELLESRLPQYRGPELTAGAADDVGLQVAAHLLGAMDEAQRRRLLIVTGSLMKYALERYTSGKPRLAEVRNQGGNQQLVALRDGMERLLIVGEESLLEEVLAPTGGTPDVMGRLRRLELVEAKNEWNKWNALLQKSTGQDFALAAPSDADDGS